MNSVDTIIAVLREQHHYDMSVDRAREIANAILKAIDGETLLDKFAGQAIVGMLASESNGTAYNRTEIAKTAYEVAEQMLVERAGRQA